MIYFIQSEQYIKIGVASNIQSRLSQLQIGNPHELKVLCLMPGKHETEIELHKIFQDIRFRGEWFYITDYLLESIDLLSFLFADYMIEQVVILPKKTRYKTSIKLPIRTDYRQFRMEDKLNIIEMSIQEIQDKYDIIERTAKRWLKNATKELEKGE